MRKFLIILSSFTFAFILFEFYLHVFFSQRLRERHQPEVYLIDSLYGYKYKPNSQDYKSTPAFYRDSISINSFGYPDQEFKLKKDTNYFRIIIVASSEGAGLDTDGSKNYITLLRDKFQNHNHKIEIINCSVDGGYRDEQRLNLIKNEIINFNADVILIETDLPVSSNMQYRSNYRDFQICTYGITNLHEIQQYIDKTHYNSNLFEFVYKHIYSFRLICKYYAENDNNFTILLSKLKIFNNKTRIQERIERIVHTGMWEAKINNINQSFRLFKNLNDTLTQRNTKLVVFQPSQNDKIRRLFFHQAGLSYLYIPFTSKENYSFKELNSHLTQEGHKSLANSFYSAIINSDIIPNNYLAANMLEKKLQKYYFSEKPSPHKNNLKHFDFLDNRKKRKSDSIKILILNPDSLTYSNWQEYIPSMCSGYISENLKYSYERTCLIKGIYYHNTSIENIIDSINSKILKENINIVVFPLPFWLIAKNPEGHLDVIKYYNTYLKKNNISLIFTYTYTRAGPLDSDYIVFNKHIVKFFLKQNHVKVYSSRYNLKRLEFQKLSKHEKIERKNLTYANTIFQGIHESIFDLNLSLDRSDYKYITNTSFLSSIEPIVFSDIEISVTDKTKEDIYYWYGWEENSSGLFKNFSEMINIDLGKEYNIDRISLYPAYKNPMNSIEFPVDIEIQVSEDRSNWTTIMSNLSYPLSEFKEKRIIDFTSTRAKCIRIYGTKLNMDRDLEGTFHRMGFIEFTVSSPN